MPPEQAGDVVADGIAVGYRLIDGAALYGNEREVGAAVRASGRREELLVVSKFWGDPVQSYDQALRDFDASLEALGLDELDLYLIHWPRPDRDRYVEVWRALVRLREEGRVRAIGVSNFNELEITRLIAETGVTPALNQVESHPWLPQLELREFHAAHGILTQAWSPLGRGRLLGDPVLGEIAARHEVTTAQVVLRWHLQLGGGAVPKSTRPERLRENRDLAGFVLDDDDLARIAGLASGQRTGTDPRDRQ